MEEAVSQLPQKEMRGKSYLSKIIGGFVALLILLIIAVILNYFNIIRIYFIAPFFVNLPHMTIKQEASHITTDFLTTTINPSLLPTNFLSGIPLTQDKGTSNFSYSWISGMKILTVTEVFEGNNLYAISLAILDRDIQYPSITASSTAKFATNYLANPTRYGRITCNQQDTCEAFTTTQNGKEGYAITKALTANLQFFACYFPLSGTYYTSAKSCLQNPKYPH